MSCQREFTKKLNLGLVGIGAHSSRNILPTLNYLPVDRDYWEAMKWNKKPCFFDYSVNPFKNTIVSSFYKMLLKKIVKVGE